LAREERKDKKGKAIRFPIGKGKKIAVQYLDSYRDYEKKVTENLALKGLVS
jgi:hypothetical protein